MPRPKTIEEADRMLAAEIADAKERHKKRLSFIEANKADPHANMDPDLIGRAQRMSPAGRPSLERDKLAIHLSEKGWKLREIALELGISVARVGQIVGQHRRQEGHLHDLSVRSMNALRTLLKTDHFTPIDVAASVSERDLRDVPNCGKIVITEIKLWLQKNGLHLSAARLHE